MVSKLAKERSKTYPAQAIMDMDYADDIVLIANTPAQAESLLYSLEQAPCGIVLHVKEDKTECMCFNQRGNISTLKSGPLKLVDKFPYCGSSISSIENANIMQIAKAWTDIDRLLVICKTDLTNKI